MPKETFQLERTPGLTLRYATWKPAATARGAVLITQGYSESIERYEHVARAWTEAGFAVAAWDLRGQGLSSGRRGHVNDFSEFTGDLGAIIDRLNENHGWSQFSPPILFGHSLGALISTVAALNEPSRFRGLGLGSPFFGLALKPAAWRVHLGRKLTKLWPTYTDRAGLSIDLLTHDPNRVQMIKDDHLRFETITARWFTETEAARARVYESFASLDLPVFCLAAADDYVADVAITRRIFANSSNDRHHLEVIPDTYHELHQEVRRDEYLQRFQETFALWVRAPNH
jgi:alpha-beta hydrolase superfamily lysophospholipase